jgi:hypothetical protein
VPDVRDRWAEAVIRDRQIPDSYMRTLWKLREFANRDGEVMVGIDRISAETGYNRRTIEKQLAQLATDGIIERHKGRGVMGNGGRTTLTVLRAPPRYRRLGAGTAADGGTGFTGERCRSEAQKVPVPSGRLNHISPNITNAPPSTRHEGACAAARENEDRDPERSRRSRARVLIRSRKSDVDAARSTGLSLEEVAELRRELMNESARSDVSDHSEESMP